MAMIDTRKLHVDDVTLLKTAQNILKTVIGPVDDVATQSVVPEPELKEEVENDAVSSEQTTIAIDGEKESLARIEDFISKSNERLNSIDGMLSE